MLLWIHYVNIIEIWNQSKEWKICIVFLTSCNLCLKAIWKQFKSSFDTKSTIWKYFLMIYFGIDFNIHLHIIVLRKFLKFQCFFERHIENILKIL